MSDSSKRQKTDEMKRVLVFGGKTGWIGQEMVNMCGQGAYTVISRLGGGTSLYRISNLLIIRNTIFGGMGFMSDRGH